MRNTNTNTNTFANLADIYASRRPASNVWDAYCRDLSDRTVTPALVGETMDRCYGLTRVASSSADARESIAYLGTGLASWWDDVRVGVVALSGRPLRAVTVGPVR